MLKLLLVDDSETARMIMQRCVEILHPDECSFLHAANGKEALELLKNQEIDLVLTDMIMPLMDGKQLLLRVKASPKLNSTPIFIVTSLGNPAFEEELKKIGADQVIYKPISPEKFRSAFEIFFKKDHVQ